MSRATFSTEIGTCGIAWSEQGLTDFWLPTAAVLASDSPPPPEVLAAIGRVQRHLRGDPQDFSDLRYNFSLVPDFNASVLRATLAVKAGETRSYGEIAAAVGQSAAASRAVGRALGANRWPLLVPCHRIVSADGKMTGFSGPGGVKTKLRLLALEGAQLFGE